MDRTVVYSSQCIHWQDLVPSLSSVSSAAGVVICKCFSKTIRARRAGEMSHWRQSVNADWSITAQASTAHCELIDFNTQRNYNLLQESYFIGKSYKHSALARFFATCKPVIRKNLHSSKSSDSFKARFMQNKCILSIHTLNTNRWLLRDCNTSHEFSSFFAENTTQAFERASWGHKTWNRAAGTHRDE